MGWVEALVWLSWAVAAWDMVRRVAGRSHEKRFAEQLRAMDETIAARTTELADARGDIEALKREASAVRSKIEGAHLRPSARKWGV